MKCHVFAGIAGLGAISACARDPVEAICPAVATGDLVVSEIRGTQAGGDTYRQWVELYNASGVDLDLRGLSLRFLRVDGGAEELVVVRSSLPVSTGGYVVLGTFSAADLRPHVDYPMGDDYTATWFPAATIEVSACGQLIDETSYDSLPLDGTWSLGVSPPTAVANDEVAAWCADSTPGGPTTELGIPGTPGQANRTCP